ncbi:hypothetical protein PIB30_018335 [Stylosanthes scabra]|uniref:Protein SHORT-ROOT-like n=1 Tax=Stylosanthes scabra TaxID=79078 RepID=A0ABU6Q8M1_9FABA|nr:hypothetical protein [Stylosanthes scabra]
MTSYPWNYSHDPCFDDDGKWATKLLMECARAINDRDSSKIQHLLWMLNELASPYGDSEQRLASYFLQALFCKATQTGERCYMALKSVSEKNQSFDSARKMILKFQEVSPWTTFGHVASNAAILEAFLETGEENRKKKLHIIDISNNTSTLCTQWPTFLESLATKTSVHVETPQVKLTVVLVKESLKGSVMNEICKRMEKFARLMRVPFEINMINGVEHLWMVTKEELGVVEEEEEDDEAVIAVNCVGGLRRVEKGKRGNVIGMLKSLNPRIVTIVEEESGDSCITRNDDDDDDSDSDGFVKCFEECLRFYKIYFDMLEESFPTISNEKLMLERECSRNILSVLSCNDNNSSSDHRRERGVEWSMRFREYFIPISLSDDVVDDVKALIKRYNRSRWSLMMSSLSSSSSSSQVEGIYLKWSDEPVLWASAWKP